MPLKLREKFFRSKASRTFAATLVVLGGLVGEPSSLRADDFTRGEEPMNWSNTEDRPALPPPPPALEPPNLCEFYQVDARFYDDGDGFEHNTSMFRHVSGGPLTQLYNLQCLRDIFTYCGVPETETPTMIGFEIFRDDCIFLEMAKIAGMNCGAMSSEALRCAREGIRCKHVSSQVRGNCEGRSVTILFDSQCQRYEPTADDAACGRYAATGLYSPISLLWDTDSSITDFYNVVNFPMNPHRPAQWHTWRASGKSPLLVYDPKHLGLVTSGAQLFGEWTFGGKSFASLKGMIDGTDRSSWKNGYEALAQLDRNGDRKISGTEIAPLALWFDRNQDAVSQPGEVVSARDAGLKSLSLDHEPFNPVTQAIHARLGYEREIGGEVVAGESVDWYGETSASKIEMVLREQARVALTNELNSESDTAAPTRGADVRFNGMWEWKLDGDTRVDAQAPTKGLLHLAFDEETGQVSGSSFAQAPIQDKAGRKLLKVTRLSVEGAAKGDREIRFRIYDGKRRVAESTAVLSADGKELRGEAVSRVVKSPGSDETNKVSYRWTAHRPK